MSDASADADALSGDANLWSKPQDMTYAVFAQVQSCVPIGKCRFMDAKYCII